jgi:hypothetical protein
VDKGTILENKRISHKYKHVSHHYPAPLGIMDGSEGEGVGYEYTGAL